MPYRNVTKDEINKAPKTLGNQLGRWAVHLDFSVTQMSKATGATRQTVYHWIIGGQVTQAYRQSVRALIDILRTSPTAEQAWSKTCLKFNLKQ